MTDQEIQALARALAKQLRSLAHAEPKRRRALSFREAATRLGVDRNTTLMDLLIRAGYLRTIPWGAFPRIPLAEIERLEDTGFPANFRDARRRRRVSTQSNRAPIRPPAPGVGDRIRALPYGRTEG